MNGIVTGKLSSSVPSSGKDLANMIWGWSTKAPSNWFEKVTVVKTGNRTYLYPLFKNYLTEQHKYALFAYGSYGNPECQFYAEFYANPSTMWLDNYKIHLYEDSLGSTEATFGVTIGAQEIGCSFNGNQASQFIGLVLEIE